MNVLTPRQQDLLHRELDGETTPEEAVEVSTLLTQPEAQAFMASLRDLDTLLRKVPRHAPPPGLAPLIRQGMSPKPVSSRRAERGFGGAKSATGWFGQQWAGIRNLTEEIMQTKTVLIGAAAAVAAIAVIGHFVVGYPPSTSDAGTIGAGTIGASDTISGVQQAGRYRGRAMNEGDVTLSNPEIQALLQDDKVLALVQSDVFRTLMRDESFRQLQNDAAYQALQKDAAYLALQKDAAYMALQKDAAYQALQKDAAYMALQKDAAYQALQKDAAYQALQKDAAYQALRMDETFRMLQAKEAARDALQKDAAYQALARGEIVGRAIAVP